MREESPAAADVPPSAPVAAGVAEREVSTRSLAVVAAGLSQPSSTRLLADRLGTSTRRHLAEAGVEVRVDVFELRDHAQDLANNLLTGFPSSQLRATIDAVASADGLIAVSPIFNASYSGLFKLFFDVLQRDALAGKPVLLGATGGTARHSLALDHALRPLFAYPGAALVPTAVYAATADWGGETDGSVPALVVGVDRAGRELARWIGGQPSERVN